MPTAIFDDVLTKTRRPEAAPRPHAEPAAGAPRACRHCAAALTTVMADLGLSPVANDYLRTDALDGPEPFYPLVVYVCDDCKLAQLHHRIAADQIFREDYAYFSSVSSSWVAHAERYAAAMVERFALGAYSRVVEVASNDGYLLQFFRRAGITVLGVEPCASVAQQAMAQRDVPTRIRFFGSQTAADLLDEVGPADLMVANNVLAHVPDIDDFVRGFATLLAPDGVATFEFPHLQKLISRVEFDTIYHEHFSYLSLLAVERIFSAAGLRVFDVETLATHGGSLRVFACRDSAEHTETARVATVRAGEARAGLHEAGVYAKFGEQVRGLKRDLVRLLYAKKDRGARIVAYGAAAKGNTLLNYCGIGRDVIDYVVDRSPHKQGLHLPGTRLPILAPERIAADRPDLILILPWNLADEIGEELNYVRAWGGRLMTAIPAPRIF